MNRLRIALVLIVVFGVVTLAQSQLPSGQSVFGKEWLLDRFDFPESGLGKNEVKCGPYLIGATDDDTFLIVGVVIIPVGKEEKGKMREKHLFLDSSKAWKTVIDESKKAPTVEYSPTNIAVVDVFHANDIGVLSAAAGVSVTIRLSQKEYDQAARCLPAPSK